MNRTNPHRPHGYGAAFERIDINYRSKPFGDAKFDLGIDAANEVDKLKPDEVLAYAAAIKAIDTSSAKRPIGEIKRELKQYAFHNPQDFYRLNKNSKEAVRLNMVEAHQYGLISYDVNTRHWVFTETEEKICTHTASQDPNQELVKFLSSDEGAEWYEVIMSRLNWWDPKQ